MYERFSENALKVIMLAQEESRRLGYGHLGTEHILLGLIAEGTGFAAKTLRKYGVSIKSARIEVEKITGRGKGFVGIAFDMVPGGQKLIEQTEREAHMLGQNYIGSEHLLLAFTSTEIDIGVAGKVLENLGISNLAHLREQIIKEIASPFAANPAPPKRESLGWLDEFGRNLSSLAEGGELDPIVARDELIAQCLAILSQRNKGNVLLVGESGVGKSAIVQAVAQQILDLEEEHPLRRARLVEIDIPEILTKAEHASNLQKGFELAQERKIILVLKGFHAVLNPDLKRSRAEDMLNVIHWFLSNNMVHCIACVEVASLREFQGENLTALRNFHPVYVPPSSVADTSLILKAAKGWIESFHKVEIKEEALAATLSLSVRLAQVPPLPQRAIDMLQDACVNAKMRDYKKTSEALPQVTEEDVQSVFEDLYSCKYTAHPEEQDDA